MKKTQSTIAEMKQKRKLRNILVILLLAICFAIIAIAYFVVQIINSTASGAMGNSSEITQAETSSFTEEQEEKILTVINSDNQVSVSYELDLVEFDGIKCDAMVKKPLLKLLNDAKKAGYHLKAVTGYIDKETQQALFEDLVDKYIKEGLSSVRAELKAAETEPIGGCSVMQTGLGVDISTDKNISNADFEATEAYIWLVNNCADYGFIQRYPEDKVQKTGCEFQPKRFRYTGIKIAQQMKRLNMSLEEYKEYISSRGG